MLNILFIGDINGKAGRKVIKNLLPSLIKEKNICFVIANGENSAGGFGITKEKYVELVSTGINVITTGNHIWDKKEALELLKNESNILRPANYPENNPGAGFNVYNIPNSNYKIGVINLIGRIFMPPAECPFLTTQKILNKISTQTNIIIVDIHAEATSEKQALGFYLDGKVSAVIGTHTHVQTADERILPNGTGFITDVGMTGPFDSVIGVEKETIIRRFLTMMPEKFEVANSDLKLNAVILSIDETTGKTKAIERINMKYE